MRYALINPDWTFQGSIYFGCREPHLPLELGYARQMLASAGHEVMLIDAHLEPIAPGQIAARLQSFAPDFIVVPTAPTYLFWRCPPPELRVVQQLLHSLREVSGRRVLIGPHPSSTPGVVLRKTGADIAVLGESEAVLVRLGEQPLAALSSVAYFEDEKLIVKGARQAVDLATLPALTWPQTLIDRHQHHHHRFDEPQGGLGAEIEASRGCPYSCSFCAKTDHRDRFRRRPLNMLLQELDGLISQGVGYIYFIDEIFLPNQELLEALCERPVRFGIQTRIDLWRPPLLDLLAEAGCVSIEAGVESISTRGRDLLNKHCRLSTAELQQRLIYARRGIPFVQATLMQSQADNPARIEEWREMLRTHGVWANKPVPLFPYPGSPDYIRRWGRPDDQAWERAVGHYLAEFAEFSDIQEPLPSRLEDLELDNSRVAQ